MKIIRLLENLRWITFTWTDRICTNILNPPTVNRVIFLAKIPSLWWKTEPNNVIPRHHRFLQKKHKKIQTLVKKRESKMNVWFLDDGNLADD